MPPSPKGFSLLTLGLTSLLSAGLTYSFTRYLHPATASETDAAAAPARTASSAVVPPWGELVRVPMVTQKPEDFIDEPSLTSARNAWYFRDVTIDQTRALFQSCGLSQDQILTLLEASNRGVDSQGILLHPPDEIILALTPEQRRQLYLTLRSDQRNAFIHYPFTFSQGRATNVLATSLRPETLTRVTPLIYKIGTSDCFSDLGALLRQIPEAAERLHLIQALTRQETILLKVRITPGTNLDALLGWWGKNTRRKDLRCILDSLASVPGGTSIDAGHLMPGFPRRRLYTYPAAPPAGYHGYDCHYSSLNFFNSEPEDSFLDPATAAKAFAEKYTPITDARQFGDIILLTRDNNSIIHSCVYIADDIVFTKNGANQMQPWVLMTLDDVLAAYPSETPWQQLTYRLKSAAE